jgi:hypothetical protein
MSLSELASIATAVSGLAVTASLIYLAIQTRQNVRHTTALIHQGTAARTTTILLELMNADVVAAWIEGNGGTPTPELIRQEQFYYQCRVSMIAMEDYFGQHELGLLSDEQFARGRATFRHLLKEPGLRAYWLIQRDIIATAAPNYCAFIDSLCTEETTSPGSRK